MINVNAEAVTIAKYNLQRQFRLHGHRLTFVRIRTNEWLILAGQCKDVTLSVVRLYRTVSNNVSIRWVKDRHLAQLEVVKGAAPVTPAEAAETIGMVLYLDGSKVRAEVL